MENLGLQIPYRPIKMQLLAIDYGSPQLFSLANLTVTPVTVSGETQCIGDYFILFSRSEKRPSECGDRRVPNLRMGCAFAWNR